MQIIADLQLHSKYSRAVSPQMTIPNIAMWAKKKGIGLVATGDWTHPLWIREIQVNLEEIGNGLLKLKSTTQNLKPSDQTTNIEPLFLLATEVSSIYSQGGKLRRVHTLIWVPTISSAEKINEEMQRRGCNLMADGRPITSLSCIQVAELVLSIEPKALLIPAHAWTPHFSVFGSASGFDSIAEAFGPFAKNIYGIETGLSSSPAMNWRIKELDTRSIISFSDAHSGPKLGREATVFDLKDFSYEGIYEAITQIPNALSLDQQPTTNNRISYTLEFYPEEGKYHYTGHRNCNVKLSPEETIKKGTICPVCGKSLTQGVMQRVEQLAGRSEESLRLSVFSSPLSDKSLSDRQLTGQLKTDKQRSDNRKQKTDNGVRMIGSQAFPTRPPFVMLVPLQEIIAETIGSPAMSPKTQVLFDQLTAEFGGEFSVLLQTKESDVVQVVGEKIAEAIGKVRCGDIVIDPGYDGVFGTVNIWKESEEESLDSQTQKEQLSLF